MCYIAARARPSDVYPLNLCSLRSHGHAVYSIATHVKMSCVFDESGLLENEPTVPAEHLRDLKCIVSLVSLVFSALCAVHEWLHMSLSTGEGQPVAVLSVSRAFFL